MTEDEACLRFRERARRVLPMGATVAIVKVADADGDLVLDCSWPLLPTSRRLRSRAVRIVISREALDDYLAAGERASGRARWPMPGSTPVCGGIFHSLIRVPTGIPRQALRRRDAGS